MGFYVGIDLGTTNSTVTVIKTEEIDDNPIENMRPGYIYQYGESLDDYLMNEEELPSAIYFDIENKTVFTGKYAKKLYSDGDRPLQTTKSIKTRMGGESVLEIPGIRNSANRESFDMVQCASLFIRTIVESLKKQFPDDDVTRDVVVTVPAAFNDDERVATQNAVLLGGFKNCSILDEPTAALLSHINSDSHDDDDIEEDEEYYKLVYDIGGGTLDVSVVKVTVDEDGNYSMDVEGLSERMNLGGDDFDRILGAWMLMGFEKTNKTITDRTVEDQNRIIARIVSNAEAYKISINNKIINIRNSIPDPVRRARRESRLSESVAFELIDGMSISGVTLDKNLLDDVFAVYGDVAAIKGKLLQPIKTAMYNAGITKDQISEVVLTGGMSKLYLVIDLLEKYFEDVEDLIITPVEDTRTAVSRGAALYHWGLEDDNEAYGVHKLTSISEKMASNTYIRENDKFVMLIDGSLVNKSGTFHYTVTDSNMTSLPLFLYSGTESDDGSDNTDAFVQLAGKMIELSHPYNEGEQIPLSWKVDKNKMITITLNEVSTAPIEVSTLLTPVAIANNPINMYKINRG